MHSSEHHAREAEKRLREIQYSTGGDYARLIAATAQVHATLAVLAALRELSGKS